VNALYTFYQNFFWPLNLVNVACCSLFMITSPLNGVVCSFWIKVISIIIIGTYFEVFHSRQLHFYFNLGYSKRSLYAGVVIMDAVVWIGLTTIAIILTR
jgi:hypothetical protein